MIETLEDLKVQLYVHEMLECFHFDGKRIWDPHK